MPKSVLRWPLKIDAAGKFLEDSSHQTGMRLVTSVYKNTRLGQPDLGVTVAFLEQSAFSVDEDKILFLVALLKDIAEFLPLVTITEIQASKVQGTPRLVQVGIKYIPGDDVSKINSFVWRFGL